MKVVHHAFPVGERYEGTMRLECPYSVSLRWRWRDKYHQLDAVAYGELQVRDDRNT